MGMVSVSDSRILNTLAQEYRDPSERERLWALYTLSAGCVVGDISRMFLVETDKFYRWAE